jgi:uncharacterized protein
MGYKEIDIRMPVLASEQEVKQIIGKREGLKNFSVQILLKSLDARNKQKICWQYRIGILSEEISKGQVPEMPSLHLPKKKYSQSALIAGSGPAGIFCALVLAEAGMKVSLIEQGDNVQKRRSAIHHFESTGMLDALNNYSFGEGGAGTFSDGKLTSRTKGISVERNYIFQQFIESGAPEEIIYMTHPHMGSDNLFNITANLRKKLENLGGKMLFNTKLDDIIVQGNLIKKASTPTGLIDSEYLIAAPGHSSYETYRMLMNRNVPFQVKNFAIGMRAEHSQNVINKAQWGVETLPGVKAAEYRLTATDNDDKPFYSFCMCPGGMVVPSTAYKHTNVVNGMSLYKRDNTWANAAVVAGVHPWELVGNDSSPLKVLDWLEQLESSFYSFSDSYKAPAVRISDFMQGKTSRSLPDSSYPFELLSADMNQLLPEKIIKTMREGLTRFSQKMKGYETGILLGLESKTSSPVQVIRDKETLSSRYDNFYLAGEGSGWAGGIVSSAADGIRVALKILDKAF